MEDSFINSLSSEIKDINDTRKFGKKRDPLKKEIDYAKIAEMYLNGQYQIDIAKEVGLSLSQVRLDLDVIIGRWQKASLQFIGQAKAIQLEKINKIEHEMWGAWEKSKLGKTETMKAQSRRPTGTSSRVELTEQQSYGDMEYMRGVMWCISERNKILGIYAPKKYVETDISGEKEKLNAKDEILGLINAVSNRLSNTDNDKDVPDVVIEAEVEDEDELEYQPIKLLADANN